MPLRLDVKKKLSARSERVKSVDFHPTEPWVLSAMYSGVVNVYDFSSQSVVKSIEVSTLPCRCAKFIARKQWIVCANDDLKMRVYSYNTLEKLKEFDAHTDYIRSIAVSTSTSPYCLSASDDMTIKLWDWDRNWTAIQIFESHAHYVMMVQWSPKDSHIFASASLDRSVKVWGVTAGSPGGGQNAHPSNPHYVAPVLSISSPGTVSGVSTVVTSPHFSLLGHERGVNTVEYGPSGDKPYLLSGSDDRTVRVWDYQTKQCIQVLSSHTNNVVTAIFHPNLPIILSGAEDGAVKIWHSSTYRLETTLNYAMERCWSIAVQKGSNAVALGYDEGTVVIQLGSETPVASMTTAGKIVWSKASEIQTANLKLVETDNLPDGEAVPLSVKDMGSCEIFPQTIAHHPNGRLFAVCGDGEYIIYTAQALRNKSFGSAVEFVWSHEGHYATRDAKGRIAIHHDFKEVFSFKPPFGAEELFGGRLLGVRSAEFVCFYDWTDYRLVRRIDVVPKATIWSEKGEQVALVCSDAFYILRHDGDAVLAAAVGGAQQDEEGIEAAFDLLQEVVEKIDSGIWVADCFVYVTAGMRLQCSVASQVETLAHLEKNCTILGYLADQNRLYLIDRDLVVTSYMLHVAMIEYQTAISQKDFDSAQQYFQQIPEHLHSRVARFLEHQGHKEEALKISKDPDHQFDLALSLGRLQHCAQLIEKMAGDPSTVHGVTVHKWKQLGDTALEQGHFALALACFREANDFSGLLLLHTAMGDDKGLRKLAEAAMALPAPTAAGEDSTETENDRRARNTKNKHSKSNIAFTSYLLLQDTERCLAVLLETERLPEAAFFARAYCPSQLPRVIKLWKEDLRKVNIAIGNSLADPGKDKELFPNLDAAMEIENMLRDALASCGLPNASQWEEKRKQLEVDLVGLHRESPSKVKDMFTSHAGSSPTKGAGSPLTLPPKTQSPRPPPSLPPTSHGHSSSRADESEPIAHKAPSPVAHVSQESSPKEVSHVDYMSSPREDAPEPERAEDWTLADSDPGNVENEEPESNGMSGGDGNTPPEKTGQQIFEEQDSGDASPVDGDLI